MSGLPTVHVKASGFTVKRWLADEWIDWWQVRMARDCGCCWGEAQGVGCSDHALLTLTPAAAAEYTPTFVVALMHKLLDAGFLCVATDPDDYSRVLYAPAGWVDYCPLHVEGIRVFAPTPDQSGLDVMEATA